MAIIGIMCLLGNKFKLTTIIVKVVNQVYYLFSIPLVLLI